MMIAVTGASGFVGRAVMERLNDTPEVKTVSISRSNCDYSVDSLRSLLKGVSAVIHLAGVKGGTGSIRDFHVNEVITENLLIAMGEEKVGKIVFASSRLVYSDTDLIPWEESQPLDPPNMYGISKVACESLCKLYSRKYGFSCAIVRVAQVLGFGEGVRNMMNVFLEKGLDHEQITVMGKSVARRQYIYVEDLAEILCRLAEPATGQGNPAEPGACSVYNAGMTEAYSNLEIAELINAAFGNTTPINYDDSFPETIQSSIMDVQRVIRETGFTPRDMKAALEDMCKNYQK